MIASQSGKSYLKGSKETLATKKNKDKKRGEKEKLTIYSEAFKSLGIYKITSRKEAKEVREVRQLQCQNHIKEWK